MKRSLIWFRKDLRLMDNPCLAEACNIGVEVLPVFIWNESGGNAWLPGAASKWWLTQALASLSNDISQRLGKLLILKGNPAELLLQVAEEYGCDSIFFGREYDTFGIAEQTKVESTFEKSGRSWKSFNTRLISEPWNNLQENGKGFQVFSKFWRQYREHLSVRPDVYDDQQIPFLKVSKVADHLDASNFFKSYSWHKKLASHWEVSESAALQKLEYCKDNILKPYRYKRNCPSQEGTSKLSPYLAWGMISPKRIVSEIQEAKNEDNRDGASKFLTEVGWREFAYHLLYHFPQISDQSLNSKFANFSSTTDSVLLEKWQTGMTGYPLVDAGMRELWETGWMHNRTRMLVASFLVKNLLIPWQVGAKWFWDTLVDADLANNSAGWQWSASTGVDYRFRVFNPQLQGSKFDARGEYVRKWIPELAHFSGKQIHSAEDSSLFIDSPYPEPCVDYSESRKRAFEQLHQLSSTTE